MSSRPGAGGAVPPSQDAGRTGGRARPNRSERDDYDCEGGSGDGPDYTGLVTVSGTDVHELDRDGDGIACDV